MEKVFDYFEYGEKQRKREKLQFIEECERRIKAKEEAMRDLKNEYSLLLDQEFSYLKNNFKILFIDIKHAFDGFHMIKENKDQEGNKLDKRKKYKEIDFFHNFEDNLGIRLGIDDLRLTKMLSYAYGEGYYCEFEHKSNEWEIYIPINPSFREFKEHGKHAFQIVLYHRESEGSIGYVDSTFFIDDLKDIMHKAVEKYRKDE